MKINAPRMVLALLFGGLLSLPVAYVHASESGRDYSGCIRACDAVRRLCDGLCQSDCRGMFPNEPRQRNACLGTCRASCVTEQKDCKNQCQAIKNGQSPSHP